MGLRVIAGMEDAGLSCSISKEKKCLRKTYYESKLTVGYQK